MRESSASSWFQLWVVRDANSNHGNITSVKRIIQVRIFRGEHFYVGECLDLPVVTQAATLDGLAHNIQEAIALHLEDEDLAALDLCPDPTILASLELTVG